MKCRYCNTELKIGAKFCPNCGEKVIEVNICTNCGEKIKPSALFCPFCGANQHELHAKQETTSEVEMIVEQSKEEPIETENIQKDEQESIESPQQASSELPKQPEHEEPEQPEKPQEPEVEEQPSYDEEEGTSSKKWLWILLALLIVGAGGWYFYENSGWSDNKIAPPEAVDTDSIPVLEEQEEYTEETPTSEIGFLEQFYKGNFEDAYIKEHVTANVLNRLKRDYDYDCPSNDCLATWVFTAYPPGADLNLEEGPIFSNTDVEGKFKVDFKYSGYNGEKKEYETRTVYLTITEVDGKYLISDYEEGNVGDKDENQNVDLPSEEVESQEMSTDENKQDKLRTNAWFVFATKNELEVAGILNEGQVLRGDFNKDYFTKIDTRIDKELKLYSKSAKILTSHPANSYTLKPEDNRQYVLRITDPQRFWATSEYLVILVE